MSEKMDDATALAAAIRSGDLSPVEAVEACLDRIEARDVDVRAWCHLDPDLALGAARALPPEPMGPLHGVPVGFKDIVDTADLPTSYGSPIYSTHRPAKDASCVAMTKAAGGIVLGKTVTTEFAGRQARETSHPLDPVRSPGGSSSGSAAAVGDGQVPLAIGSQTAGSTIRPAAYCGVHALKPSFQALPFSGMKHLCERLDTIGLMARSVRDLGLFRAVLLGIAVPEVRPIDGPLRIGLCRTPYWSRASAQTQEMIEAAAAAIGAAGHSVVEVAYPDVFGDPETLIWEVIHAEMGRQLATELSASPASLSPWVRQSVEHGLSLSPDRQAANLTALVQAERAFDDLLQSVDALISPAAEDVPPVGLAGTGSPIFNLAFHIAGLPAINLPWGTDPSGLPLGLQVIGKRFDDAKLLRIAAAFDRLER